MQKKLCLWCFSQGVPNGEKFCCGSCHFAWLWDKGDNIAANVAVATYRLDASNALKWVIGANWWCRECGAVPVKTRGDVCPKWQECRV